MSDTQARSAHRPTRHVWRPGDGLTRIDQHTCCRETTVGLDVTGPYWVFAFVTLRAGTISYLHGTAATDPPHHRFGVFLPPYSVVQCRLESACVDSRAVASRCTLADDLPAHAIAFPTSAARLPSSVGRIEQAIRRADGCVPIGGGQRTSAVSRRVKALIDARYGALPPLHVIARRLGVSPAAMSRGFSRDYGMSPVRYRHAIRVMDAMMRLVDGEPICDVAGAVGFHDLGRFYHHFGALAAAPPGFYRRRSGLPEASPSTWLMPCRRQAGDRRRDGARRADIRTCPFG